jgi:hypothetical protein
MAFEVIKRRLLLGFLLLTTLFLAWSLCFTGKSSTIFSDFILIVRHACIYLEAIADEDMVTALCYSSLSIVLGRAVKLQVA